MNSIQYKIVFTYTTVCSDKGKDKRRSMSAIIESDSTSNFLYHYSLLNFNVHLFKTFTHTYSTVKQRVLGPG